MTKFKSTASNHGFYKKEQDQAAYKVRNRKSFNLLEGYSTDTASRDLDQVHADLKSAKHLAQHKESKAAEDLPGLGQWYCTECAKWFEGEHNLLQHRRGKNHKRRFVRLARDTTHPSREGDSKEKF